jgi:hypothetical protein
MHQTRRQFLATSAAATLSAITLPGCVTPPREVQSNNEPDEPWYRRTLRWGQTNISEADPNTYDIPWWRTYWKRTSLQGLIVNAGGIVAYYPTKYPLQFRPPSLGDRDLFGELLSAARADGLAVLARMDSSRAHENFYNAHPDWFALDANGRPHKAGELFVSCVNSPYYTEYLPGLLREIAERYHPEGFADNSWSGLGRDQVCYCDNCRQHFRNVHGQELPKSKNWDDPVYKKWILWNYDRRLQIWDLNNQVTKAAGGPNCLWVGMNSGSIAGQSQSFRDFKQICSKAELILLDHQARGDAAGFSQNADIGQLIHQLLGWNKLIPESMAMYQAGQPTFRKTAKPPAEARLWMLEGFAGGIQPWWHHVGAQQEDRRQFETAEPIFKWHQANQQFLVHREPVASVGLVWSQRNMDFFGRDHPESVELPWRGWTQALLRARIPYLAVHAEALDDQASNLSVLILPNIGALSDAQAASVRRLVQRGCALISTGRTGLYDEWGQPRPDFILADLLGCHYLGLGREGERPRESLGETLHTYLRIETKPQSDPLRPRHEVLAGFDETNILPFGGWLGDVVASEDTQVLLTYVPAFPIYPPEMSWMREPRTHIPGLILNNSAQTGRTAFLIADLDRRFASDGLPDHGQLLANLVRWAAQDRFPFRVQGPGVIDCRLYRQANRFILHLVNLSVVTGSRGPIDEPLPVGPIQVRLPLSTEIQQKRVRLLVNSEKPRYSFDNSGATVILSSIREHEVIVFG